MKSTLAWLWPFPYLDMYIICATHLHLCDFAHNHNRPFSDPCRRTPSEFKINPLPSFYRRHEQPIIPHIDPDITPALGKTFIDRRDDQRDEHVHRRQSQGVLLLSLGRFTRCFKQPAPVPTMLTCFGYSLICMCETLARCNLKTTTNLNAKYQHSSSGSVNLSRRTDV